MPKCGTDQNSFLAALHFEECYALCRTLGRPLILREGVRHVFRGVRLLRNHERRRQSLSPLDLQEVLGDFARELARVIQVHDALKEIFESDFAAKAYIPSRVGLAQIEPS